MSVLKGLSRGLLLLIFMVGGYFAGTTREPSRANAVETSAVPTGLTALSVDVNVTNPTAILLGEAKVPDELLSPPAPPWRTDLIVPDLNK